MSYQATDWVQDHGPDDRVKTLIMLAIARRANKFGENSIPGLDNIVKWSRCSRSKVCAALIELEEEGWVDVTERGRGRGHATVYRIPGIRPAVPVPTQSELPLGEQERSSFSEERSIPEPEKVHSRGLSLYSSIEKNTQVFEEFWNIYPRPESPDRALEAWLAATTTADAATILAGARRFAATGVERRYAPLPARWLTDRRWLDDLPAAQPRPVRALGATPSCTSCHDRRLVLLDGANAAVPCPDCAMEVTA